MSEAVPSEVKGADELQVEHLFRHQSGRLVAGLVRIFGAAHLDLVEDVVQEAFLTALRRWPYDGVPDDPTAWIVRVAKNRALDVLRRHGRWRSREAEVKRLAESVERRFESPRVVFESELPDEQLSLMFACCHPLLARDSQVALVLKTVGGFSVDEIARAFLTRPATVAQRLVRAKRRLRELDVAMEIPAAAELPARVEAVSESLYLMFNEGYGAFEGEDLIRSDLCREATRLAELVAGHPVTGSPQAHALAALFYFQAARLPARSGANGELMPLGEQDRARWDHRMVKLGLHHFRASAQGEERTDYHLQAEIASCHSLAESEQATDWGRILDCYDLLLSRQRSPVVALNRAVALFKVQGTEAALHALSGLDGDARFRGYAPFWITRGELLREAGLFEEAERELSVALELAGNEAARSFIAGRIERLPG